MIIIGFSGPANSGKDTAAACIARTEFRADGCDRAIVTAFARPLKLGIIEMFDLDGDAFIDRKSKERPIPEIGKSPRELAQIIGTEIVRAIHPNAWIISMDRRLSNLQDKVLEISTLLITDVRFENEAAWVREKGGTIVHIARPFIARWEPKGHESERGIERNPGDYTIINEGTLEEFERHILSVYSSVKTNHQAQK